MNSYSKENMMGAQATAYANSVAGQCTPIPDDLNTVRSILEELVKETQFLNEKAAMIADTVIGAVPEVGPTSALQSGSILGLTSNVRDQLGTLRRTLNRLA